MSLVHPCTFSRGQLWQDVLCKDFFFFCEEYDHEQYNHVPYASLQIWQITVVVACDLQVKVLHFTQTMLVLLSFGPQ